MFTSSVIGEVQAAPDLWSIETVDTGDEFLWYPSIALDSNDYPHISYYNTSSGNLKYAQWIGSYWDIDTVDFGGDVGAYSSLALDASGYPHISYLDSTNINLKYARWTGSIWSIETVDSVGDVGAYSSLALDASGYPHISYTELNDEYPLDNLKYARWTGSEWDIDTVDSGGNVGWYTSLALDSSDNPHISYFDETNQDLKYAWWSGTNWNIDLIDSGGNVGEDTSLALDTSDHPHISYFDWDIPALKYARWTGSEWSYDLVESGEHVDVWDTSIALDSNDYPHIGYILQGTVYALKYARWTGSEWAIETVDSVGAYGWYASLALDSTDHPHIGYYRDFGTLKYARAPNEYFYSTLPTAFDSNGDGWDDALEVEMDVDTTYDGTLPVDVRAYLYNSTGSLVDNLIDPVGWSITHDDVEFGYVSLYAPSGAIPGLYDVSLSLYDGDGNHEDQEYLSDAVYLYPPDMNPPLDSCTEEGVLQDSFELAEPIAVMGEGYVPSASYGVYVVVDTTWTDGLAIPSRVADTATTVTSNTEGVIEPTVVWTTPLSEGAFDVVVDTNGNGQYDAGVDALDDSDIEVTAGVIVIPEFTIAMLVPILVGIGLIAVIVKKRLPLS
jgi:hypothetical protein